jgi:hypothetical protein
LLPPQLPPQLSRVARSPASPPSRHAFPSFPCSTASLCEVAPLGVVSGSPGQTPRAATVSKISVSSQVDLIARPTPWQNPFEGRAFLDPLRPLLPGLSSSGRALREGSFNKRNRTKKKTRCACDRAPQKEKASLAIFFSPFSLETPDDAREKTLSPATKLSLSPRSFALFSLSLSLSPLAKKKQPTSTTWESSRSSSSGLGQPGTRRPSTRAAPR